MTPTAIRSAATGFAEGFAGAASRGRCTGCLSFADQDKGEVR